MKHRLSFISPRISMFLAFLLLITNARGDSITVNAVEGEDMQLEFLYPCDSTKVTLRYRNRAPLYNSLYPNSLDLHPDQFDRLAVVNVTERGNCSIQLRINPVKLSDKGPYILDAYSPDHRTRIMLYVEFPSNKLYCRWNGWFVEGYGMELLCTAPTDRLAGQIQCFQGGMRMVPLNEPSKTQSMLMQQTILVLQNKHYVFCCTSTLLEPEGLCECNDFVWDPIPDSEVIRKDPCPADTPVQVKTISPTYHATKYVSLPAATTTSEGSVKSREGKPVEGYFILIAAVIVIITSIVAIIYKCLPWRRLVKNCKNDTKGDELKTIPKDAETQTKTADGSSHLAKTTSSMASRTFPRHPKTQKIIAVSPHLVETSSSMPKHAMTQSTVDETTSFITSRTSPKHAKIQRIIANVSPHPDETTSFIASSDCEGGSNDCGRDFRSRDNSPIEILKTK